MEREQCLVIVVYGSTNDIGSRIALASDSCEKTFECAPILELEYTVPLVQGAPGSAQAISEPSSQMSPTSQSLPGRFSCPTTALGPVSVGGRAIWSSTTRAMSGTPYYREFDAMTATFNADHYTRRKCHFQIYLRTGSRVVSMLRTNLCRNHRKQQGERDEMGRL